MGANATTFVPTYVANEVLTAADLNVTNSGIPVFTNSTTRDAGFGGVGEKTLAQGQFCYLESTGKLQVYTGSAWANVGSQTNVAAFTTSGTWTVPAGVTYAIAYIRGGGGAVAPSAAGTGGTSSVAFAGGTISATGGAGINFGLVTALSGAAGTVNSGLGARGEGYNGGLPGAAFGASFGGDGSLITAGGAVTAAASITVTVGAGGAGGANGVSGGSGYVYIEYEV